jgi:hypothetical protein
MLRFKPFVTDPTFSVERQDSLGRKASSALPNTCALICIKLFVDVSSRGPANGRKRRYLAVGAGVGVVPVAPFAEAQIVIDRFGETADGIDNATAVGSLGSGCG